mmetsp:Transcript_40489/g.106300  ORF Transcript_40489/g.106300 Transcript_40489/m.106300 type:complete len:468 (-) Transcript_40489:197-1600(-)
MVLRFCHRLVYSQRVKFPGAQPRLTRVSPGGVRAFSAVPEFDCYAVLGVSPSSPQPSIKEAYRKKCLSCHPDLGGDVQAFLKIQAAFEALHPKSKREEYDRRRSHSSSSSGSRNSDPYDFWYSSNGSTNPKGASWEDMFGSPKRRNPDQYSSRWEEDFEDFYADTHEGPYRGENKRKSQKRKKKRQSAGTAPPAVELQWGKLPRGLPDFRGRYDLIDWMHGRPVYKSQIEPHCYIFWSPQTEDWIVDLDVHHQNPGVSLAFSEDSQAPHPGAVRLAWFVYQPQYEAFRPYPRMEFRAVKEEQPKEEHKEPDPNRPNTGPVASWTIPELQRWCATSGLDIHDCLDKETLVKLVALHLGEDPGDADARTSEEVPPADEDQQSQNQLPPLDAELCSRAKTNGSYTHPPRLDERFLKFGNRIEPFLGCEEMVVHWLRKFADHSRVYGVYTQGKFRYCLVWSGTGWSRSSSV